ncbi:tyrosine-type recombinase/integrase [Polaribacter sp. MSW13]|uniref:Tyrosine-type recombinase/integrase n=1 Tax=Polaribacter marinus TaxID=2916838 RepID=A0A9X2AKW9_9FLAO|nr:tyrosine-type recombinase/integrase [Polaribacter marinus]MCI2229933.1 tyrosine-type recombinase/integrase [Polaribacter marinus]
MNIELLAEDFCHHAKYIRGVSEQTLKRYRQNISNFSRASKINHISDVNQKKVQSYFLKGRVVKNWTPQTYRTYYMSLLVFFRWCVKHQYLTENYVKEIEIPKIPKSLPKKLTQQQASLILEVAYNYPYTQTYLRYRNHALFSMFLFTGLRRSELLNLKLTDVDVENHTVFVKGKGDKDRIIPLNTKLVHSLERYLVERKKKKKTCSEFFTSSNRNSGFTDQGLKKTILMMRKSTGIYFKAHQLRHTFATLMLEGGCDIFSLSKMMGHSDIKTTTIYLSATAEHLRSQVVKHPMNATF